MKEIEKCVYCGNVVTNKDQQNISCCSEECYKKTKEFISKESKYSKAIYLITGLLVLIDVIVVTYMENQNLVYLPLTLIGLILFVFPELFIRFFSYQSSTIRTKIKVIKKIGSVVVIVALLFLIMSFL